MSGKTTKAERRKIRRAVGPETTKAVEDLRAHLDSLAQAYLLLNAKVNAQQVDTEKRIAALRSSLANGG